MVPLIRYETTRYFVVERAGVDIPMADAVQSYIHNILPSHREEAAMIGRDEGDEAIDAYVL